ncbi:hypothetical protein SAMN05216303_102332 [Rhodoferax sp. OV413]|uniref:hypothetical protein n=1 Tax=Rhodoferax sp. OV413 TaxID=1855285 RepID=UPI00088BBAA5|nr:hypothetical protein [Rhodoferax sp. OV413]SDO77877.1 hypothetical protein SAMN05216303_102332 [Rhodoferax sp. OV413]
MWDAAILEYEGYLRVRGELMALGLTDALADEYLDILNRLSTQVERLDPYDADFRSSDHSKGFAEAAASLKRMAELLGCK